VVDDWEQINWVYHQIGWYSNVYDGCIRLDNEDPYVPTIMSQETYESELISLGTIASYDTDTTTLIEN
jgi:hypothetical protein